MIWIVNPAQSKEAFATFYKNIETNKNHAADIFIWNLKKDIFDICDTNPPWRGKICEIENLQLIFYLLYFRMNLECE